MKYCCDKCEKPVKTNVFGQPIRVSHVSIKEFFTSNYILCEECSEKLYLFLKRSESE